MKREVMITTIDNPFDPFTQFDSWLAFDERKNYKTCSYLARVTNFSEELSESASESVSCFFKLAFFLELVFSILRQYLLAVKNVLFYKFFL
jgi:hypothetical protein